MGRYSRPAVDPLMLTVAAVSGLSEHSSAIGPGIWMDDLEFSVRWSPSGPGAWVFEATLPVAAVWVYPPVEG